MITAGGQRREPLSGGFSFRKPDFRVDDEFELAAKFGDSDEPKEKAPEDQKGYSGDPERPFSRGRAYKPERYGRKDSGDSANEQ